MKTTPIAVTTAKTTKSPAKKNKVDTQLSLDKLSDLGGDSEVDALIQSFESQMSADVAAAVLTAPDGPAPIEITAEMLADELPKPKNSKERREAKKAAKLKAAEAAATVVPAELPAAAGEAVKTPEEKKETAKKAVTQMMDGVNLVDTAIGLPFLEELVKAGRVRPSKRKGNNKPFTAVILRQEAKKGVLRDAYAFQIGEKKDVAKTPIYQSYWTTCVAQYIEVTEEVKAEEPVAEEATA